MVDNVVQVAVHDLRRKGQGDFETILGRAQLKVSETVVRVVNELHSLYSSKASKAHGKFSEKVVDYPAQTFIANFEAGKYQDFADLTKKLMETLTVQARRKAGATGDRHGVQGEFAIIPEGYVAPWPDGFSAEEACSVWMQYLTAYYALVTVGQLSTGKAAVIAAAASSAGIGAIHTAKAVGATAIATTRQPSKVAFLRSVGADHVIVTEKGVDFSPAIRAATDGKGADLVFDPVSGSFSRDYCNGLNWEAKVVNYGQLEEQDPILPILPLTRVKATFHPYSMFNHVMFPDELAEGIAFVMRNIREGRFRPVIDKVFSLDQTREAYHHMLGNSQCGKIVVRIAAGSN